MKISACVIVRNEAKNIGRWLENMQQVADELIVVDTGSEDRTIAIAEAAGVTVYPFVWCDDFAAAKNYALSKATGDWILFLDADEYFSQASLAQLRPLLERMDVHRDIWGIFCRLINIDVDDGNRFSTAVIQLRIFRNLSALRYQGRIHEALKIPEQKKAELVRELTIYHTGYSHRIVKAKMKRNLQILTEQIRRSGGKKSLQDERYLMDIWYGLGESGKAVESARKIIAQAGDSADLLSRAYETWASVWITQGHEELETLACLDAAMQACPARAEFPLMKGLYLFEHKDYLRAEECLQQGGTLHAAYSQDVAGVSDNAERLLPTVEWRQAELALLRFDGESAQEHFLRGLRGFPYHRGLFRSFWSYLRRQGIADADAIELLNQLYDKKQDAAFLADMLAGDDSNVYLYYARRAGRPLAAATQYLAAGRFEAAAEKAAQGLDQCCRLGIWAAMNGHEEVGNMLPVLLPPRHQAVWQQLSGGQKGKKLQDSEASLLVVQRRLMDELMKIRQERGAKWK